MFIFLFMFIFLHFPSRFFHSLFLSPPSPSSLFPSPLSSLPLLCFSSPPPFFLISLTSSSSAVCALLRRFCRLQGKNTTPTSKKKNLSRGSRRGKLGLSYCGKGRKAGVELKRFYLFHCFYPSYLFFFSFPIFVLTWTTRMWAFFFFLLIFGHLFL